MCRQVPPGRSPALSRPVSPASALKPRFIAVRLVEVSMHQTLVVALSLAMGQASPPAENAVVPSTNGNSEPACAVCQEAPGHFFHRLIKAYCEYLPKNEKKDDKDQCQNANACGEKTDTASTRRALPPPFPSPPFPTGEWQGFPLIGLPPSDSIYPL